MHYFLPAFLLFKPSWQLPHDLGALSMHQPRDSVTYSFDLTRVLSTGAASEADEGAGENPLLDVKRRQKFLVPVTIQGQVFNLEVDTGSSDTWVIGTDFTCYKNYDPNTFAFSGEQAQDTCNFGNTYTPGFSPNGMTNLYISEGYGDGSRHIQGPMGYIGVNLGDISVTQLIGVPNESSFPAYGDHQQSGVIGLGLAGLTSAYVARPPTSDNRQSYSPIIQSIFDQHEDTLYPQFSLALSRDESQTGYGGVLTIGGLPDNTSTVNYAWAEPTAAELQLYTPFSTTQLTFYSILIDNFIVGSSELNPKLQIIIDSGDAHFRVPAATADAMNALWSPPPLFTDKYGTRAIECDSTLTQPIGIGIGGANYFVHPQDFVGQDPDGSCFSYIIPDSFHAIGDPFLKNVVANFNLQVKTLAFYARNYYES